MNRPASDLREHGRWWRDRAALGAATWLLLLVLLAAAVPAWSPHGVERGSDLQFAAPDRAHWMGTDVHGRDVFTRVFAGMRISLLVAAAGGLVSLVIGVGWGMVAGYVGGRLDAWMMRGVDVLYSLPTLLLVIVVLATAEDGLRRAVAGSVPALEDWVRPGLLVGTLGLVSWLTMARIVRGQVLSLRERPFVLASRSLGATTGRLLLRHLLPHTLGVAVVYLTLAVPGIILSESFLSYLGLGIRPPQASLGLLIAEGAGQINPIRIYWWLIAGPGVVLATALLALTILGRRLRRLVERGGEA